MTFGNPHRTDYTDSEKAFITEQARPARVVTASQRRNGGLVACCMGCRVLHLCDALLRMLRCGRRRARRR
jgi:hypothetical protein